MFPVRLLLTAAVFSAALPGGVALADPPRAPKPHQVVLISFDGDKDVPQWQRSRKLAAVTGARFTYFLSCVYLLTRETRGAYAPPGRKVGSSNVGFADSKADVADRLREIWNARAEGHDIASHGCGHFDGKGWTKAEWLSELGSFHTLVRDAYRINRIDGEPRGWRDFVENDITGFRAPYLSPGPNLAGALASVGFRYNASGVSRRPALPDTGDALTTFALPQIPEGPGGRRVIAMDYNLFVRHSGGFERGDRDGSFEQRSFDAFKAAFDAQYYGARVPLQLGFHFTLMNDAAYWRALERFARNVCLRADVDCISYADYAARQKPVDGVKVGNVGG